MVPMLMYDFHIRRNITDKFRRRLQGIASLGMFMGFHTADRLRLHRDGREDQRIGGTEDHYHGQRLNNPLPGFSPFAVPIQFHCCLQQNISHNRLLLYGVC